MRQLTDGRSVFGNGRAAAVSALLAVSGAHGQACTPEARRRLCGPGVNGPINASIMYDAQDGEWPATVCRWAAQPQGKLCNGIAMWNGIGV